MVVRREAYRILKTGASHLSFQQNLAVLDRQGLVVGDINHSRKFVSEFTDSVATVLQERQKELMQSPLEVKKENDLNENLIHRKH